MRSRKILRDLFPLVGLAITHSLLLAGVAAGTESPAAGARRVFFSSYFLTMAENEIATFPSGEQAALRKILDACPGTLVIEEVVRLRCQLITQQFLMAHRRVDTKLYRLLDSMEIMKTLVRYNLAIGRESEAGIDRRLGIITAGLEEAVDSNLPQSSADQIPPEH